ncbi:hypothetical protein ES705_40831 [subsurface metagenome]
MKCEYIKEFKIIQLLPDKVTYSITIDIGSLMKDPINTSLGLLQDFQGILAKFIGCYPILKKGDDSI